MENELKWNVTVDGTEYAVKCVKMKSLYEIYVDGELAIKAPRQMKHTCENSEYDLRIGGKRCQFVVYDGDPDLCVDGILLGAQAEMDRKERRNRRLAVLGGLMAILMSSYATFLWVIYEIGGKPIFGGVASLVFIQIIFWGGIALVIGGIRKKKKEY